MILIKIPTSSNDCAVLLAEKVPNTYETVKDQIAVYDYGFQVYSGIFKKGILLSVLSWLLGVFIATWISALTFASLRILGGGYHMQTYSRCLKVSLGMFITAALISQYTYQYWTNIHLLTLFILTIILAIYIIIRYVPRDTPTKPIIEPEEIKKFKRWSFIYLSVWTVIMINCLYFRWNLVLLSSCLGLLLELFSISKLGNVAYRQLDGLKNH